MSQPSCEMLADPFSHPPAFRGLPSRECSRWCKRTNQSQPNHTRFLACRTRQNRALGLLPTTPSLSRNLLRELFDAPQQRPQLAPACDRLCSIAPGLRAFLFPCGAPVDLPPCILHRPLAIAGDWQGLPILFVRARHLGLRCMGNLLCMRLILRFCSPPPPC